MSEMTEQGIVPEKDFSKFFHDPEFIIKYPDIILPPPTFVAHEGKVLAFKSGKNITLSFPVREFQMNPVGTLQGGILSSFIDDAFGCLCFASLHKPCVSIDMTVNFIRPVKPGAFVIIRAEFKAKGRKLLQCSAEAFTGNEKLVATASSNLMVYET
jgi:acyl-CoA thioesterase